MLAAIAERHGAYVAMVNQVGGNDSLVFDGSSVVIGPDGEVVVRAASFVEDMVVFDTEASIQVQRIRRTERLLSRTLPSMGLRSCGARWCWGLGIM